MEIKKAIFALLLISTVCFLASCYGGDDAVKNPGATTPVIAGEEADLKYEEQALAEYEIKKSEIEEAIAAQSSEIKFQLPNEPGEWDTGSVVIKPNPEKVIPVITDDIMLFEIKLNTDASQFEKASDSGISSMSLGDVVTKKESADKMLESYAKMESYTKSAGLYQSIFAGLLDTWNMKDNLQLNFPDNISLINIIPPLPEVSLKGGTVSGSFPFSLGRDKNGTPFFCEIYFVGLDLNNLSSFDITNVTIKVVTPIIIEGLFVSTNTTLKVLKGGYISLSGEVAAASDTKEIDDNFELQELDHVSGSWALQYDPIYGKVVSYTTNFAGHFTLKSRNYLWHIPGNAGVDKLRVSIYNADIENGNFHLRFRVRDPYSGRSSEVQYRGDANSIFNTVIELINSITVLKELAGTELDTVTALTSAVGFAWVLPAALILQGAGDQWYNPKQNGSMIIVGNFIAAFGDRLLPAALFIAEQFKLVNVDDYNVKLSELFNKK